MEPTTSIEMGSTVASSTSQQMIQQEGDGRRIRLRLCYGGNFVAVSVARGTRLKQAG